MITYIVVLASMLVSGILMVFVVNATVNAVVRKKIKPDEPPIALDLIKAVLFISGALLIGEAAISLQTMTKVLSEIYHGNDLLFKEVSYASVFVFITICMVFVIMWISIMLYSLLSKGNYVILEVVNNNYNALILFIGLILTFTLALKAGLTPLLEYLIPYPTIPFYN
jgi:hypothetical protein